MAVAAGVDVAHRLTEPTTVDRARRGADRQTHFPVNVGRAPYELADGDAGLAVLYGHLDVAFPAEGWDAIGHGYLVSASRAAAGRAVQPGLFGGLAGLDLATMALARGGARYRRLAAAIEAELVPETHALAQEVQRRADGLPVQEFDAISGLAGIASHLLAHRRSPAIGAAAKHAVQALVELVLIPGANGPRWRTPPELGLADSVTARSPGGTLNCGLAHGVPGIVAALALALADGVPVDGLERATADAASWLVSSRCSDGWGVTWPAMIETGDRSVAPPQPARCAWCYGSPGVARSLFLAGRALDDHGLQELAVEAVRAVFRRPVAARQVPSPTFCHGVAGLLQITLRMAHDTGLADLRREAVQLTEQLLDAYVPQDSLFGFRSLESDGNPVEHPGLLDGAAGVALVLLAAALPVEPRWDRAFLLT